MTYLRVNTINDSIEVEVDDLADVMAYITDDVISGEIHNVLSLAIDESLEDVDVSEGAMAALHSGLERSEADAKSVQEEALHSRCQRCNRPLKNTASRKAGYGKVCAQHVDVDQIAA